MKTAVIYPLVYVFQVCFDMIALALWVQAANLTPSIAGFVTIVLSIPITFLAARFLFGRRREADKALRSSTH